MAWDDLKYTNYAVVDKPSFDDLDDAKKWLFNCTRVYGAPPQFTSIADPRVDLGDSKYTNIAGRSFIRTMGEMPSIVSLYPGEVQYLNSLTGEYKGNFLSMIAGSGSLDRTEIQNLVDDALGTNKSTMFYTIKSGMVKYMKYVNMLNRFTAVMMNIGDHPFPGTNIPYKSFNWIDYTDIESIEGKTLSDGLASWEEQIKTGMKTAAKKAVDFGSGIANIFAGDFGQVSKFLGKQYIHFYASSQTSYSEDISTSTKASMIESLFTGSALDSIAKEIAYIGSGLVGDGGIAKDIDTVLADSGDGVLDQLLRTGSGYLSGARIIFPQILDEVQFGRTVTVNCKFISPSGDPEAVYLHCFAPLNHILAAAFPLQYSENMYRMPFICKLYSKGWFNFDMAVISNVRINKGGDDTAWATNRLPTEIDVTFDVTALYSKMMITSTDYPLRALGNYAMMEYLGSMCCVNMETVQLDLKFEALKSTLLNKITDFPPAITNTAIGNIMSKLNNAFTLTKN